MPFSLTYIAVAFLAILGIDNAEEVVESFIIIAVAGVALYGRYRALGINWWGKRQ